MPLVEHVGHVLVYGTVLQSVHVNGRRFGYRDGSVLLGLSIDHPLITVVGDVG